MSGQVSRGSAGEPEAEPQCGPSSGRAKGNMEELGYQDVQAMVGG